MIRLWIFLLYCVCVRVCVCVCVYVSVCVCILCIYLYFRVWMYAGLFCWVSAETEQNEHFSAKFKHKELKSDKLVYWSSNLNLKYLVTF